jgi:hypothetical protein
LKQLGSEIPSWRSIAPRGRFPPREALLPFLSSSVRASFPSILFEGSSDTPPVVEHDCTPPQSLSTSPPAGATLEEADGDVRSNAGETGRTRKEVRRPLLAGMEEGARRPTLVGKITERERRARRWPEFGRKRRCWSWQGRSRRRSRTLGGRDTDDGDFFLGCGLVGSFVCTWVEGWGSYVFFFNSLFVLTYHDAIF